MLADEWPAGVNERARQRRLRTGVLRLGSVLGLDRQQVIRLAEVVTGCSWRQCGCEQFEQVIAEYSAIVARVMARQRCTATSQLERGTHAPAA